MVALSPATVGRQMFLCCSSAAATPLTCWRQGAGLHARDESISIRSLRLPQARETFAVVGGRAHGHWGLEHGVNEHQLAVAYLPQRSRFRAEARGLEPRDLVRLTLERCRNVTQAVDLFSQCLPDFGSGLDAGFMLADPAEALVLETAGRHWAVQSVREVRALATTATIRQDWDRVSAGLGSLAIERGWWPDDGRKVDFAGVVTDSPDKNALRDWGRDTLWLEQRNGLIERSTLRQLLAEGGGQVRLIAELAPELKRLPIAWFWIGGAGQGVYLPLFVEGELPEKLRRPEELAAILERFTPEATATAGPWLEERLADAQARLDSDAETFAAEGADLRLTDEEDDRRRLATLFMEHAVERFLDYLPGVPPTSSRVVTSTPAAEWSWL